jgi:nucleoside-diphosphate-sugar epimerase
MTMRSPDRPGAAMVGGISYINQHPFDLLVENERIAGAAFEAAIEARQRKQLRKITVISSSMVYENATSFPTKEGEQLRCPPPSSSYGFQKLSLEYFARAAFEQHGLGFTIVRPFNCVGIGDRAAQDDAEITSGDLQIALSHVLPDLIQKVLRGQDPLHILGNGQQVRHFTSGADVARGIRLCMEQQAATNEEFNISVSQPTTILELAQMIWRRIHGPDHPFRYVCDPSFPHDVQYRSPSVEKAEQLLGFRADITLQDVLDEVISWVQKQFELGTV